MDLRSGSPLDGAHPDPEPAELAWRVSPPLTWVKLGAVVAFLLVVLIYFDEPTKAFAAAAGAVLLGVYALRDVLVPVRLAADVDGVTVVRGYAGYQRLPWSKIERVGVDERSRLGIRVEMLEIDAGDSLHLFSTYDLNAPCSDVVDSLNKLRGTS
jgi:hypothetical protein